MLLRARSSYCCLIVHQSITIPAEPRCGMTDALHIGRHDCRAGSYPSLHARKWTPGVKIARYMHCTHQRMCTFLPQPAQRFRIGFHQSSKVGSAKSPDLGTDGGGAKNVSLSVSQRIFLLRTQKECYCVFFHSARLQPNSFTMQVLLSWKCDDRHSYGIDCGC
jgi:hypothetical protein